MSAHSLATRYAKSLISLATEKGQLDAAFKDVKLMSAAVDAHRDFKVMLKSPIINTDKKLAIVKQIFEGKVNTMLYAFLVLLVKKGREGHLPEILHAFLTQYNQQIGITPVKLTTAVKLDAAQVNGIITSLKKNEKLKEVELHEKVDESLIGGFILQFDDKMIDSSVSRRLAAYKTVIEDDTYIKKYS